MTRPTRAEGSVRLSTRWPASIAAVLTIACIFAAAIGGARTPNASRLGVLAAAKPLDYARDPSGRVRRLNSAFVSSALGIPTGDLLSGPSNPGLVGSALVSRGAVSGPGSEVRSPLYPCVNGHQTEDPLSPACVASFIGDNGAATWRGVTGKEVRVLVYMYPSGPYPCDPAQNTCGSHPVYGTYADLGQPPPSAGEDAQLTALRLLQEYFNRRYQTYGRRVHLFAYFTDPSTPLTPAERYVEEADENRIQVQPFASIRAERPGFENLPPPLASDLYQEELARYGIVSLELNGSRTTTLGERYPGLIWSYRPSIEQLADLYGSYLCAKVVGRPTALSGNVAENGRPRRLAIFRLSGPQFGQYDFLASRVRDQVQRCGGHIDAEVDFPIGGDHCDGEFYDPVPGTPDGSPDAAAQIAKLRAQGITTVLWLGCVLERYTLAAQGQGWMPEWVLLGSGGIESNTATENLGPVIFNRHAILITPKAVTPPISRAICARAMAEVDPTGRAQASYAFGCPLYPLLRQIFSAIQRAGPRLTPAAIATAEQADSPSGPSPPEAPPCLYRAGDFSCLKDAEAEIWDSTYTNPSGEPVGVYPLFGSLGTSQSAVGCWRSISGGARYLPGHWPPGNVDAQLTGREACNDPSQIGD